MAFQSWAFGDGQSGFGGDAYLLDGSYLDSACFIFLLNLKIVHL